MLDLVVNVNTDGARIAVLKDGELSDLSICNNKEDEIAVGDVYFGVVTKVSNNLGAAFVDIGTSKVGFLHSSDLNCHTRTMLDFVDKVEENQDIKLSEFPFLPPTDKNVVINDIFTKQSHILVQVIKEPISSKGPRLSTNISLAGNYVILVPFSNSLHISKNIVDADERARLTSIINAIRPNNFGIIVRTAGQGVSTKYFVNDLQCLLTKWRDGIKKIVSIKKPTLVISEDNRIVTTIRNMLFNPFNRICVDDAGVYQDIKKYLDQNLSQTKAPSIDLYNNPVISLFEHKGIEKQIKLLFNRIVYIKGGGYLVMDQTEAMHVIDVNSGTQASCEDHEEMAYNINISAATEIARQLRIRDIGGIIAIDFIDMESNEHRYKVYNTLKELMLTDIAKHVVYPLTKVNVMLITRQRVRSNVIVNTNEKCPMCNGVGNIEPAVQIVDKIDKELEKFVSNCSGTSTIYVTVHPFLCTYFTNGFISHRMHWLVKYRKWIVVKQDCSFGLLDYRIEKKN